MGADSGRDSKVHGVASNFISKEPFPAFIETWMLSHDSSVGNRFSLWLGSLRMIVENPQGVGLGESGRIYTLFYQPEGVNLAYRTLVNSFLTFVAEQGLFIGMLAMALALFPILAVWTNMGRRCAKFRILSITCLGIAASLGISGMLSTCFDLGEFAGMLHGRFDLNAAMQSSLLFLGAATLAALSAISLSSLEWKTAIWPFLHGLAIASVAAAALSFAGCSGWHDEQTFHKMLKSQDGGKWMWLHGVNVKGTTLLLHDEKVLGARETISFAKKIAQGDGILIPLDDSPGKTPIGCDKMILCGRNSSNLEGMLETVDIMLPVELPPFEKAPVSVKGIWLDPFDEYGVNSQWEMASPSVVKQFQVR